VRGDLDWVVMKCLDKDRNRRYETANDLAKDVRRFLTNEPIAARPPTAVYRFRKTVRRNKLAFVAGGAVLAALIGGLGISIWLFIRETRAHEQTFAAEQKQERLRELAEQNRQLSEARLYAADMNLTEQALAAGNVSRARDLLNAHRPQSGLPDFRGFEWRYFWKQCQSGQETTLHGHVGEVSGLSFSPDGQTLVTCGADRLLRLWDLRTKLEIAVLRGHENWPNSAIFSRDGRVIASACDDGTTKLWDVASRTEITTLTGHVGKVFDSSFSPDGTLATCGEDGTVRLWNVASHRELAVLRHTAALLSCDFSRDGTLLATGGQDRRVTLWDVASRQTVGVLLGHDHEVQRMTFSPDGKTLATASEGESIRLWDVASRQEITALKSDTARFT
jgi:dipeptidyl aminopeptidase/acylaminoacyl peptidase